MTGRFTHYASLPLPPQAIDELRPHTREFSREIKTVANKQGSSLYNAYTRAHIRTTLTLKLIGAVSKLSSLDQPLITPMMFYLSARQKKDGSGGNHPIIAADKPGLYLYGRYRFFDVSTYL